jgi:hypothetical protein
VTSRPPTSAVLLLAAVLTSSLARAANVDECVQRAVAFDGIESLNYAAVTAAAGTKVYLHTRYPADCNVEASSDGCKGSAYLLSGDAVAVGKSCGSWAYVQFIGARSVSRGWVLGDHLKAVGGTLPFDDGPASGLMHWFVPGTLPMQLIRGHDVPVCEAYLQRLNQTVFHEPPYCGRPENDRVPGFTRLHRVALQPAQITSLFGQLHALQVKGHAHPPLPLTQSELTLVSEGDEGSLVVWAYEPKADIENSGSTANVVIWRGRPADEEEPAGICGVPHDVPRETAAEIGYRPAQVAIVTSGDYMTLDEVTTKAVFGHPTNGLPVPNAGPALSDHYQSVGGSMSVFEYHGEFYFDSFFWSNGWADFEGKRANLGTLRDHLGVFQRKGATTRELCEYVYDPNRALLPTNQDSPGTP